MNICMMTNTFLPHVGGVARSVHTFSEDYLRQGHEVLIVAPRFPEDDEVPAEIERHVVRLPAVQRFNGSDFSVRLPAAWMFQDELSDYEPDIVHSHHPYLLGDSALRYARDKGVPVVYTHHTLHEEYTHYVPFNSNGLKRFVIELCTCYANLCDAVVAPSESIADLIRERGVTVPIEVIPTGIDVAAFGRGDGSAFRGKHGIPRNAPVIGHLGRLAPEKNLTFLAQSVAEAMQAHAEARFLLVGAGPSEAEIEALFAEAGLSDRIIATGKLVPPELYDAYAAMDLFVFTSHSETQGMVLVEAMATATPVVALDASGVREVLRNGHDGLLLPANSSAQDFSGAILRLLKDDSLREELGDRAAKTATSFDRKVTAGKMLQLYGRLSRKAREHTEGDDEWSRLLKQLELEWELIKGKTESAMHSLGGDTEKGPSHARPA